MLGAQRTTASATTCYAVTRSWLLNELMIAHVLLLSARSDLLPSLCLHITVLESQRYHRGQGRLVVTNGEEDESGRIIL